MFPMKRALLLITFVLLLLPTVAWGASNLSENVSTSVVFIVNYDQDGKFLGWGSGFFVDEGIVVTNKHVIEGAHIYRIYATGKDEKVNASCFKKITKSDIRVNLDDDVAYMRVYLDCAHGIMDFADDPKDSDPVSVLGYPYKGSVTIAQELTVTTGTVIGHTVDGWVLTDAHMDLGSSGGPVVNGTDVLGVSVAKSLDENGEYAVGYFIPSSVILKGLLYANDSRFGYTPRSRSSSSSKSSRVSSSVSSSANSVSSATATTSSASASSSTKSATSKPTAAAPFPDVDPSRESYDAILSLRERGIINGYSDGTFRPDIGINRAEFIKILVAGYRSGGMRNEGNCFTDVREEWFAPYVCEAKRLEWISGYPDGAFRPEQRVNRAEAMKILVGAFGGALNTLAKETPPDVRSGTWFYAYVAAGVEIGIVDPNTFMRPKLDLTREMAAMWIEAAE